MLHVTTIDAAVDPEDLGGMRALLAAETKGEYGRFKRSLTPDFGRVRKDVIFGYAALALTLLAVAAVGGGMAGILAAFPGAVGVGYWIAYLQLFIHEAAHYNLARDKRANDRVADSLICWQVGTNIASYRRTHSEHHRFLGEVGDTELSYTHPLTARFLIEMATGIHALRVFTQRKGARAEGAKGGAMKGTAMEGRAIGPLFRGLAIHGLLIGAMLLAGAWSAALAWVLGVGVVFPVLATLRQSLEHRPTRAETGHPAVTRIFGDDPFSRTFGGAGFNRHLLHHLEPNISYTRLADFEAFLMKTSVGPIFDARRTSYAAVFSALLKDDRNG